jgi:Fe-S cluster assembly protein SufD
MSVESQNRYREEFARLEPQLAGVELPWLRRARCAAFDRFAELGFPTTRHEDWKYTNVAAIEKRPFRPLPESLNGVNTAQVNELAFSGSHLLVFVNGRYSPRLSRVSSLPSGASIMSLATALAVYADQLEPLLTRDTEPFANGFPALNAAFWADGAYIDLAADTAIEEPIHLLFIATEADLGTHPRNIVRTGAGSRVSIIEHYVGMGSIAYFTNAVTRIIADRGAVIEHCKLQQESGRAFHVADIHAQQGQDSRFTSHSFALGGALSRNDITTRLDAEGCEATLNGLYVADGRQHMDHHTCIEHAKPRGVSREFYNGVLDGAARAVFNGKVIVRPDAQKTDAHQSNRNLLLSENAEVDTKPQLEIFADDVKCSHGATVGQLDENQIFYLRTRGMDEPAARSLLTYAFAEEIISRSGIAPLRARLEELLINRLPDAQLVRALS